MTSRCLETYFGPGFEEWPGLAGRDRSTIQAQGHRQGGNADDSELRNSAGRYGLESPFNIDRDAMWCYTTINRAYGQVGENLPGTSIDEDGRSPVTHSQNRANGHTNQHEPAPLQAGLQSTTLTAVSSVDDPLIRLQLQMWHPRVRRQSEAQESPESWRGKRGQTSVVDKRTPYLMPLDGTKIRHQYPTEVLMTSRRSFEVSGKANSRKRRPNKNPREKICNDVYGRAGNLRCLAFRKRHSKVFLQNFERAC